MNESFYPIVIAELSEEDGGGFVAYVPDLYGCMGDGETPEEALGDAQKAIIEWTAEMNRLGREIPRPGSAGRRAGEERERLRSIIQTLANEAHAVISAQSDEIDRLICKISDLQTELCAIEESMSSTSARLFGWSAPEFVLANHMAVVVGASRQRH